MPAAIQVSLADFDIANGVPIGVGALGQVLRVQHKPTGTSAACKVLSKIQLLQSKKVESVMREKEALLSLGPHPLIARLFGTAQSDDELYFFMEEMPRGDLQEHICRLARKRRAKIENVLVSPDMGGLSMKSAFLPGLFCLSFSDLRLITAQLVLALEHVHTDVSNKHHSRFTLRDLKSENICFDVAGRCVLIDFDCIDECKGLVPESNFGDALGETQRSNESDAASSLRRKTISAIQESRKMSAYNFCGTAQFVSPEILGQLKWSYSSDLWALGVVVYQMLFGRYPFDGEGPFATMKEIIKGIDPAKHFPPISRVAEATAPARKPSSPSPSHITSYSCDQYVLVRSFVEALLVIDPTKRLGVASGSLEPNYEALRNHPMFAMATRCNHAGASDEETFVPPIDWGLLKHQLGLPATTPLEIGKSALSYSFVPLASRDKNSLPPQPFSLLSLYDDVPSHDDAYNSHVNDICSSAGPLDEALMAHHCHDEEEMSRRITSQENKRLTEEEEPKGEDIGISNAEELRRWLVNEWITSYLPRPQDLLPVSSAPSPVAHMALKAHLLSQEVIDYFTPVDGKVDGRDTKRRSAINAMQGHYNQWRNLQMQLSSATSSPPMLIPDIRLNDEEVAIAPIPGPVTRTDLPPELVQALLSATFLHTRHLEASHVDKLIVGLLGSAAKEIEALRNETVRLAEEHYLQSVATEDARRRADGIAIPLGVNNPYAPYSERPIIISDLQAAIKEVEEAERENRFGDCDDVIDDVGADRHGLLQRADNDFSQ